MENKGLSDVTRGRDLDRLISDRNSCSLDKLTRSGPFGIGVKVVMDSLYIKVKEGGWRSCIKNAKISSDIDLRYFAVVSNNQKTADRVSNIDIESIQFYNLDADAY